jgi:hypothetical protein
MHINAHGLLRNHWLDVITRTMQPQAVERLLGKYLRQMLWMPRVSNQRP